MTKQDHRQAAISPEGASAEQGSSLSRIIAKQGDHGQAASRPSRFTTSGFTVTVPQRKARWGSAPRRGAAEARTDGAPSTDIDSAVHVVNTAAGRDKAPTDATFRAPRGLGQSQPSPASERRTYERFPTADR